MESMSINTASKPEGDSNRDEMKKVLKDSATVLVHSELKALQLGASAGLLLAIPALSLYPMKFNADDTAPLVRASMLAGQLALTCASAVVPFKAYRLSQLDAAGIATRAQYVRTDERERKLRRYSAAGACVGMLMEGVRLQSIASMNGTSVWTLVCTNMKVCLWELTCLGVLGCSVGVMIPTAKYYVKNYQALMKKKRNMIRLDDGDDSVRELQEDTESAVKESVEGMIEDVATSAADDSKQPNGSM